jgi:LPS-assembly protein
MMSLRTFAAALLLGAAPLALCGPAHAQSFNDSSLGKIQLQQPEQNTPMLLQADDLIYDNANNTVTARGNVEIYYGNYTLTANQVIYDRGAGTLNAEGDVRIKEPTGAVIAADRITLTDDFRDGFVRSLSVVTQDDERIAAARATRMEGEVTEFEAAAYTPCKPCETNPEAPPTWRIRAGKITHNKTDATITYRNAAFEFFGTPIAYVPYFRHADPTVKRKSGFLVPSYSNSDELGSAVEIPYYFALDESYDFTFSPVITEKAGVLLQGLWRQRTRNGGYRIDVAGVFQDDREFFDPGGEFRGSIKTSGDFWYNSFWNYGWDVTLETDDTFRRFYQLESLLRTDRISQGYLVGMRDRNYFGARIYQFNGLLGQDTDFAESWVHPVIDYNYIFNQPVLGGELAFDANALALTREDGSDNNHVIGELKWRRQMIDPVGQVWTPFARGRTDLYYVSDVFDPVTGAVGDRNAIARATAVGGVEYRFPFVAHGARATHIFEPIGQLIARPDTIDQDDIPNEDARSLVFDDTILFDIDKFSGYDRIETGTRADIGVRYTMQLYSGSYLRAVFGQSYQLGGPNAFEQGSGLETARSDYVTGVYFQANKNWGFVGQARFDEENFETRRTDISTWLTYGPISGSITYADIEDQNLFGFIDNREEILASGTLALTDHWSLVGQSRYDIADSQRLSDGIGLRWADDCFSLTVTYEQNFYEDRDIEPGQVVALRFSLKNLGAYDLTTDIFGGFGATSESGI